MKMNFDQLYELMREPSAKEIVRLIYELNKEIEELKEQIIDTNRDLLNEMDRRSEVLDKNKCDTYDIIDEIEEREFKHYDEIWDRIYKIEDRVDKIDGTHDDSVKKCSCVCEDCDGCCEDCD